MDKNKAFKNFIEKQSAIVIKICRVYSNDTQEFDDYFQEVTLQLWRSYDTFRGESKVSTWVYRIALNVCLSQIRKKKRSISTTPIDNIQVSVEQDDDKEQKIDFLYTSIKQLKEAERALILLYLDDKSYKEIADILGLTVTNVGAKVNRIKQKLKTIMTHGR
jgi:RNA polymerase sigma-70 factor (ECF subfamily)